MAAFGDGPASPHFSPLHVDGFLNLDSLAAGKEPIPAEMSAEMAAQLSQAPQGTGSAWGIPFAAARAVFVAEHAIELAVPAVQARWLIFLHTSDLRPQPPGPGGILSPMRGEGQLNERAATYVLRYQDGSEARAEIRRRHQIGMFQRRWGENCFEAVPQHKPFTQRGAQEQLHSDWGWTQTRVGDHDGGSWTSWLWAWENPRPDEAITGLRFEPGAGAVLISAVSIGQVAAHPLRWSARQKACLRLPEGQAFLPDLDENGLLSQVQLDLGQVISAASRQVYPAGGWPQTYANQPPELAPGDILLEYTAHPDACFHLALPGESQRVPLNAVERGAAAELSLVPPAERLIRLRVVERGSTRPVAVKLHAHGAWGEYLAPVNRHRILNPAWFEDYSADHAHIRNWREPQRAHAGSYIPGETRIRLPLGQVYLEITKGFEIRPLREVVEITPTTDELVIELDRVLPWRQAGWVTADTHVHFLSPMTGLLEGAAEGVNVVNLLASQWGELMTNVGDFDGHSTWGARETGGDGEYLLRVGSENRQHVLGHISLLGYHGELIAPMTTGGPDESALGDPVEALLTEWARACRAQDGLVVLPHFPNPRAEHAAAVVAGQIDAVEMTSWHDRYSGISPYSLSDWYRYLNCGYLLAAVGGTDKMAASTAVGTVRTYARILPGVEFTYEAWKDAVRRAETFVTYGPLLDFRVSGLPMGSRLDLPAGGGSLDVEWQVASVTLPASRVELMVNGEIRASQAVDGEQDAGHWSVRLEKSAWLALLVRGHYPGEAEIIAAHSSPVIVSVAGAPLLAAADALTILEQIEGAMVFLDTIGTRAELRAYQRMRIELEAAHRALHNRMHQAGYYHDHTPLTNHPSPHS